MITLEYVDGPNDGETEDFEVEPKAVMISKQDRDDENKVVVGEYRRVNKVLLWQGYKEKREK